MRKLSLMLVAFILHILSSCQHSEHKLNFNSPQDLVLDFKFNETSQDIKKKYDIKKYIFDKLNCYTLPIQYLDFPGINSYNLIFDDEDRLFMIMMIFPKDQYEKILYLYDKYDKAFILRDEHKLHPVKNYVVNNLSHIIMFVRGNVMITINPLKQLSMKYPNKKIMLEQNYNDMENSLSKYF